MQRYLSVLTILLLCALVGCTGTPYQPLAPETGAVGYSDRALPNGMLLVSFSGNPRSDKNRVHDFALLRAAEVVKENGLPKFRIEKEIRSTGSTAEVSTLTTSIPYASDPRYRQTLSQQVMNGPGERYIIEDVRVKTAITITLIVTAMRNEGFLQNANTYDCDTVIQTIRKKYGL